LDFSDIISELVKRKARKCFFKPFSPFFHQFQAFLFVFMLDILVFEKQQ